MSATITALDVQKMVRHWLKTPVNGYLGSDYGQDLKSILQTPLSDATAANSALKKLTDDVEILQAMPSGSVNIYGQAVSNSPDKLKLTIEIAGQPIEVTESTD